MAHPDVLPAACNEGPVTAKPGDFEPQENTSIPLPDDRPPIQGPELGSETSKAQVRPKTAAQR